MRLLRASIVTVIVLHELEHSIEYVVRWFRRRYR